MIEDPFDSPSTSNASLFSQPTQSNSADDELSQLLQSPAPQSVVIAGQPSVPTMQQSPYGQGLPVGRPTIVMPFSFAIKTCMNKSFEATGRASRSEFWWFWVFYSAIGMMAYIASMIMLVMSEQYEGNGLSIMGVTLLVFYIIFMIIIAPAALFSTIRRLHDTGRSGWWFCISFVPLVGGIILLFFLIEDGEMIPNLHGPVPTNREF